jgi:hypothetical protein
VAAIHLFRCKAEPRRQTDAFAEKMPSSDIVALAFLERPTTRVPRGAVWHIGNATETEDAAVFFALGREAVVRAQHFDEGRREFREVEETQSPFTVGVYDRETQATGILVKPGVSLSAREVANKLEILLKSSGIAQKHNAEIVVDFIPDPEGFIEVLRKVLRVTRFEFEFSPPNSPDDELLIQRPLKEFAERARAVDGSAIVRGPSLNVDELIPLTHALASTGDNATANVQMRENTPIVRRNSNTNSLREPVEADLHESTSGALLRAVRRAYQHVRNDRP